MKHPHLRNVEGNPLIDTVVSVKAVNEFEGSVVSASIVSEEIALEDVAGQS